MYHQFKQLADIDITQSPMEVGPTTHYMMGGVRVDAASDVDGARLVCRRRVAAGLHGSNRLGGNSRRTSWFWASAPANLPPNFPGSIP
jgi:succinate dehydrogenase / fumarate reductase flavoprotein subunit